MRGWCCGQLERVDEAQIETKKSEVTFKTFRYTNEEEEEKAKALAKAFREEEQAKTGKVWSEVMQGNSCYYVAYCLAGELVVKAVDRTSRHFNLNIPLGADYVVGRNWKECH